MSAPQPTITDLLTCELCYQQDLDVKIGLAWYRDATPAEAIQSIARCVDDAACRTRVEDRGDRWPLRIRGEADALAEHRRRR